MPLIKAEHDAMLRAICTDMDLAISNAERAIDNAKRARLKAMEMMQLQSVKQEAPGGVNAWAYGSTSKGERR